MILDSLDQCQRYCGLNPRFAEAFAFLQRDDLADLPPGEYPIEGDQLFARIVREPGTLDTSGPLELHRNYIDIQYVVAGSDGMGWKSRARCSTLAADYNPATDAQFFANAPESTFQVKPGSFALFFPDDAHRAMISSGVIHKVIIKVAV